MRIRPWKMVFAVWLFFWLLFLVRGLLKGEINKIETFYGKPAETRRAIILGEDLYDFLQFFKEWVPPGSTYDIISGMEPIDRYRSIYYLYPIRIEKENPEFILWYKDGKVMPKGYYRYATYKNEQIILRKR